jgi:hypothetical protein
MYLLSRSPSVPSSSGKSLNLRARARAQRPVRGRPDRRTFSPLIIGEVAQLWYFGAVVLTFALFTLVEVPFSPLIIGEVAQRGSRRYLRGAQAVHDGASVPSSSGKSLNTPARYGDTLVSLQSPHHRGNRSTWSPPAPSRPPTRQSSTLPSVPSSSGKSLNSALQEASRGAGLRVRFEEPPQTAHSNGSPFGPVPAVRHAKSPCVGRVSTVVEEGTRVFGPKELLNRAATGPFHPVPVRPIQRTAAPFHAPAGAAARPRGRARRPR